MTLLAGISSMLAALVAVERSGADGAPRRSVDVSRALDAGSSVAPDARPSSSVAPDARPSSSVAPDAGPSSSAAPDAGPSSSAAPDAGAPSRSPGISFDRTPADPAPIVERRQWLFDFRWDRGDARVAGVRRVELDAPQATPRVVGRFALELYEGSALLERVRFDFPLLAVPEPLDAGALAFGPKLRTRTQVLFPVIARGTRLELVDRSSKRRWPLAWPPDPSDAGG